MSDTKPAPLENLTEALLETRALYKVTSAIIEHHELADVLETVVNAVAEALPADRVTVITFDIEKPAVTHFVKGGAGSAFVVTVSFEELWDGLSGWVLREGRPALSPKSRPDSREQPDVQKRRAETNAGDIIVVPIGYQGKIFGTMTAINDPKGAEFGQGQVDLMVAMASHVAVAVTTANLFATLTERTAELELAKERAEKSDRMKSEFLANMSHELRTPLTSIRGSLGLLVGGVLGELPEKAESMLRIAHQNSERLVLIINDILDMEKIQTGKIYFQIDRVPVRDLLHQAIAMNQAYADKFQVTLTLETVAEELTTMADAHRLMQVLTNLLSNAAKFSPAGAEVRVRAQSQGERIRFEIQDQGIGISEEFHERIFEKFSQAEATTERRFGGTGLGLAISKSLVAQMGGQIGFVSHTGDGTMFFVELPSGSSAATANVATPASQVPSSGNSATLPRVLHVEDDQDLTLVLQELLAGRAEVVAAPTLRAAQELLGRHMFSLLVLDLGLPDGNGLALLDQVERMPSSAPPIVILSATEVPRDIQRRVAATLTKSRIIESEVADKILSAMAGGRARKLAGS